MGFVHFWVKFRTSYWYLLTFMVLVGLWLAFNRLFFHNLFDNDDLTYLNLTISIITELQAVVLLIYVARNKAHDDVKDQEDKENMRQLIAKLNDMHRDIEN